MLQERRTAGTMTWTSSLPGLTVFVSKHNEIEQPSRLITELRGLFVFEKKYIVCLLQSISNASAFLLLTYS